MNKLLVVSFSLLTFFAGCDSILVPAAPFNSFQLSPITAKVVKTQDKVLITEVKDSRDFKRPWECLIGSHWTNIEKAWAKDIDAQEMYKDLPICP